MTVMWITDQKCTSWVEYGTGDSLYRKAFNSEHGLVDAYRTIHRVDITGLSPGKEYGYRVCSKEILRFDPYEVTYGETLRSDMHSFETLAPKREGISFVVLNDIHDRTDLLARLMKMAASKPYDLVFFNGDVLGHIEDEAQLVNLVLKPSSELFATEIPFVYVRGNHEARGKYARMLPKYLGMPGGKYYYSFDHGPVHFIVMDGGENKADSHSEYAGLADFDRYREQQKAWLEKEIRTRACKKAKFRIVLAHMPPKQSKDRNGPDDMYNDWRPLFNRGKIDLFISGHTHRYMITEPKKGIHDYALITGGSQKDGQATVIRVNAKKKKLQVTMTRDDGEIVGRYESD